MVESKKLDFERIVFFDGICHLCNGFVDFALQNGTAQNPLAFAPLQGETAQRILSTEDRENFASVIFYENGHLYKESTAVFKILSQLRGIWGVLGVLGGYFPAFLRNGVYRWVAKNRYNWFGVRDSCRIPLAHEKNQLLP